MSSEGPLNEGPLNEGLEKRGIWTMINQPPWVPEQCRGEEMLHILPET